MQGFITRSKGSSSG